MSRTPRFVCLAVAGWLSAVPSAARPQQDATHAAHATAGAPAATHKHYDVDPRAMQPGPDGQLAPRLQNLGTHVFPVTTKSERAQRFVNQGVNLAWAFNHGEAGRAFREAARLDPSCVMAYWGQALVLGPNINAVMDAKDEPKARELAQKALSMKAAATPREQALIEALAVRYTANPDDRRRNDEAYAAAMKQVVERFPDDLDATALYIEAMMNLRPWDYWQRDGQPQQGYAEIMALTERVLEQAPQHPGALHLYIHLMESMAPHKAVTAADRLLPLMPAAGHMVHMPSHIYHRVGRYQDAIRSNELAVAADEDYITQCRAQGMYPMAYYPHNVHFLWWSTTFDGQSARAIEAAKKVAGGITDAMLAEAPLLAGFRVVPYWALARFGRWDEVLALPAPPATSPFLAGARHYVRGLALVAKGSLPEAEAELAALRGLMDDKGLDAPLFSPNLSRTVLAIGPEVLAGEIAAAKRDYATAIAHLERAVRLEDGLVYTEPTEWHFPPRQALGAVLLAAGRAPEAETVYWEDLRRNPANGWSLYGAWQALLAQGKKDQAAVAEARFKQAWSRADVTLTASRFGAPAPAASSAAAAP
jgi:tetratricopeptide (TPR) repeat protein